VSEEGSSHLTHDGWAETQNQIGEIYDQIFHGHVKFSDEEERERSTGNVREQIFPDYDLMSFIDVGPVVEISVDIGKSVDIGESVVIARSDFVDNFGMRDEL
jgi:hypothetical protein